MPKPPDLAVIESVPLRVRPETLEALVALRYALQDHGRLYHDCVLLLRRLQRTEKGPLTDALAAFVGEP